MGGFNWLKRAVATKPAQPEFELSHPVSFYRAVRKITGSLTQRQVDTVNGLLKACHDWPLPWVAYALGTAWHEARLDPQPEWGRGVGRYYSKPTKYGGQRAYGRGLVQLTHDYNYEWADERLSLGGELLQDFDLALDPDISARILKLGLEEGAFNPKRKGIAHYIPRTGATRDHYRAARTLVNLNDKADLIAGHALAFGNALYEGGWK